MSELPTSSAEFPELTNIEELKLQIAETLLEKLRQSNSPSEFLDQTRKIFGDEVAEQIQALYEKEAE